MDKGLSISFDLAVGAGSFSLWNNGSLAESVNLESLGVKSDQAVAVLVDILERSGSSVGDISEVVCSRGPGGYTGIRAGLAMAQGLRRSLGIPVYGYSLIDVLHHEARAIERVTVVLEGGRNEALVSFRNDKDIDEPMFVDIEGLGIHIREANPTLLVLAVSPAFERRLAFEQQGIKVQNASDNVSRLLFAFHIHGGLPETDISPIYGRSFG